MNGGTELGGLEQGIEGRDDGITQALRCYAAMDGQDFETRLSLWRAAGRYARREKERMAVETLAGLDAFVRVGE